MISNELQATLLCGYATVKAGVTSVTDSSVLFGDGTQEDDIDIIVCATGYNYRCVQLLPGAQHIT